MKAVNLIPAEQRGGAGPGIGRSEGGAYAVLALLAGVAIFAVLYGGARHEISSRRAQAATLAAQAQRAQTEASQLAPYTSFIALRTQRQQAVSQLVDTRFDWAHVLHEFGRVLPFQTSIASISGTVGSASTSSSKAGASSSVSSATPPGTVPVFTLTGCSTSQRAVALTLERLRLIDGVSEVSLQSSSKGASSGGGASGGGNSGGCPSAAPSFTVQVTFDPLPTPTAGAGSPPPTAVASATSTGAAR